MTRKKSILSGLLVMTSLVYTSCPAWGNSETATYTKTDFAMDPVVSETLYTSGEDITDKLVSTLKDIETNWLSWTDEGSQIYQLNQNAGSTQEVSDATAGYLQQTFALSEASDGAMDPTMGKVIRLWDIDGENPHVPDEKELNSLLEDVGYKTTGKITPKAAGKTTITVTCGSAKTTCTVTVKNPTLTLTKSSASISVKKTTTIKAKATPSKTIKYKSSNTKVATVNSKGVVKGIRKGKATITVTCNGVSRKFTVTVK